VEVYGAVGSYDVYGVPISTYTLDGGPEELYTAPIIESGYAQFPVLFYASPVLGPGNHTLVLTNRNGTAPSTLWLDYLLYTPADSTPTTTSIPSSSATSLGVTVASSTTSSASISLPSSTSAPSSSANVDTGNHEYQWHTKTPVGAIAGSIVGGLALLGTIIGLIWWCRLRRYNRVPSHARPYTVKSGARTDS
jgi:hypothetical protein